MEKQRRTEYKTSYKQIHACPPTLTTNPRSIGTKLHRLKVCMQLSLAPSGLKVYLPSSISPALSVLHSLHLMNLSHHLCTLLQLQRLTDVLESAVQEWFQHFQLWKHTLGLGDKKAGPEDVHSMQKSRKWVLADLLLLYKEKCNGWFEKGKKLHLQDIATPHAGFLLRGKTSESSPQVYPTCLTGKEMKFYFKEIAVSI